MTPEELPTPGGLLNQMLELRAGVAWAQRPPCGGCDPDPLDVAQTLLTQVAALHHREDWLTDPRMVHLAILAATTWLVLPTREELARMLDEQEQRQLAALTDLPTF